MKYLLRFRSYSRKLKAPFLACIISMVTLFLFSCKEEIEPYVEYDLTFYIDHPNYEITPHQFETITEQVLVRDAHNEGATFDTRSDQVLVQDAYNSYQSFNQNKITIENDCETNTSIDLNCREFLDSLNIIRTQHPATYMTRTYEVVLVNGNGPIVPATYTNRTYKKLVTDGTLMPISESSREKEEFLFRLPFGISIDDYIQEEFKRNGVTNCVSGISYTIN